MFICSDTAIIDAIQKPQVGIQPVKYWKMKGGKIIAISDMTDTHLINTINMLRRQVDGSIHDDFVYDNIDAMEKELKKRQMI